MDEDGFFFIVDRIKDLIICSGYNVYPRRIEEAIYEHPAVEEVTVIGIKDKYRGEAPKAFIKLKAGRDGDGGGHLQAPRSPSISKIEMPAEIEFRDALPKTMIGKLSKKELKAEEAEEAASVSRKRRRPNCSPDGGSARSRCHQPHRRPTYAIRICQVRHHDAHDPLLRKPRSDRA